MPFLDVGINSLFSLLNVEFGEAEVHPGIFPVFTLLCIQCSLSDQSLNDVCF